eukprot:TRINITY_DN8622_c0_g1_i4.p1 TRINITY_DN8622_c0_g1~~TRINITY_DN8622_c0_g1_i4.p1  ORF type:complete len:352 (-),score=32.56 TRINITY_DN8622_c0_g1_i4:433-1449(-)
MVNTLFIITPSVVLSILGSSFVILSYVLFKEYRNKSAHHFVICCMAISDCLYLAAFYSGFFTPSSGWVCTSSAYFLQFASTSSWTWPAVFAIRLLFSNTFEMAHTSRGTVSMDLFTHITGWVLPMFVSILCGMMGLYGHAQEGVHAWCWIDDAHPSAQIFLGNGLVVITFSVELSVLALLLYSLRDTGAGGFTPLQSQRKTVTTRLCLFLVVPPLCWTWAVADRVVVLLLGHKVGWLSYMHIIMGPSQGFFNALVYGFDPELIILWRKAIGLKTSIKKVHDADRNKTPHDHHSIMSSQNIPVQYDVNKLYDENEDDDENDHHDRHNSDYYRAQYLINA